MYSKFKTVLNLSDQKINNMTFKECWEYGDFITS